MGVSSGYVVLMAIASGSYMTAWHLNRLLWRWKERMPFQRFWTIMGVLFWGANLAVLGRRAYAVAPGLYFAMPVVCLLLAVMMKAIRMEPAREAVSRPSPDDRPAMDL
jgi:hypothetical protein